MKLMKEARFTDDKEGYLRQKHVWNKELAKWSRGKKGNEGLTATTLVIYQLI